LTIGSGELNRNNERIDDIIGKKMRIKIDDEIEEGILHYKPKKLIGKLISAFRTEFQPMMEVEAPDAPDPRFEVKGTDFEHYKHPLYLTAFSPSIKAEFANKPSRIIDRLLIFPRAVLKFRKKEPADYFDTDMMRFLLGDPQIAASIYCKFYRFENMNILGKDRCIVGKDIINFGVGTVKRA
jgi:hypothetical protein